MFFYDLIEAPDLFIDISKCLNIRCPTHTLHSIFMSVNPCIGGNIQKQKMCFIFRRQLQQLVCLKKLKTVAEVSFYNLTERERPGERGR